MPCGKLLQDLGEWCGLGGWARQIVFSAEGFLVGPALQSRAVFVSGIQSVFVYGFQFVLVSGSQPVSAPEPE